MRSMRIFSPLLLLLSTVVLGGANCTERALCEQIKECANDPPGEDFVEVCTRQRAGETAALRANSEDDCVTLATAQTALDACRAQLTCDDFQEGDLGGECDNELDDYNDAFDDAANNRIGGSAIGRGGPGPSYNQLVPLDCSSFD